jgi:hypothetical protein
MTDRCHYAESILTPREQKSSLIEKRRATGFRLSSQYKSSTKGKRVMAPLRRMGQHPTLRPICVQAVNKHMRKNISEEKQNE